MATDCQFGELKNDLLRDQFIFELASRKAKENLLLQESVDFEKAVCLATLQEKAKKEACRLDPFKQEVEEQIINKVGFRRDRKPYRREEYAGRKRMQCYKCGKYGYIARYCRSDKRNSEEKEINSMYCIEGNSELIYLDISIENQNIQRLHDSVAIVFIINKKTFEKLKLKGKLEKSSNKLESYTKTLIGVVGELPTEFRYKDITCPGKLVMVKEGRNLLGLPELKSLD